jgi:hypothetical protein
VIVASPHLQTNHPQLIIKIGEDARLPVVGPADGSRPNLKYPPKDIGRSGSAP